MVQTVFNKALGSRGETGRFFRRLRRWILKGADPLVTWEINGRKLRLPLSHELPFYRKRFPAYSSNLERLAALLRSVHGSLVLIDVGANIGDSIALAGVRPGDACLLIEGDPVYFKLLQQNTADLPEAVCIAAMLSDQPGKAFGQLVTTGGTGQIISDRHSATEVCLVTLDSILQQQPRFQTSHLLKIDVDGYDFRVLRGAEHLVRKTQPVLFFEQDPRLLECAGENPDAVWEWLRKSGYDAVLLYDNLGYWLGNFPLNEPPALRRLNAYARQQTGFYYDVAAFAPPHARIQADFEAQETGFFQALGHSPG